MRFALVLCSVSVSLGVLRHNERNVTRDHVADEKEVVVKLLDKLVNNMPDLLRYGLWNARDSLESFPQSGPSRPAFVKSEQQSADLRRLLQQGQSALGDALDRAFHAGPRLAPRVVYGLLGNALVVQAVGAASCGTCAEMAFAYLFLHGPPGLKVEKIVHPMHGLTYQGQPVHNPDNHALLRFPGLGLDFDLWQYELGRVAKLEEMRRHALHPSAEHPAMAEALWRVWSPSEQPTQPESHVSVVLPPGDKDRRGVLEDVRQLLHGILTELRMASDQIMTPQWDLTRI